MTQPPTDDLGALAAELNRQVANLRDSVVALRNSHHRTTAIVRALVCVVVFVVLLGVGLAFVAVDARQASHRAEEAVSLAHQNTANARLTCEIGNEARATQRQLWAYVLNVSSEGRKLNPTQLRQLAQFRAYVEQTFAPRDCDSNSPTVRPPTSTPTR